MSKCRRCGTPIEREAVREELRMRTGDIPETCERAAVSTVFCGLTCALEDTQDVRQTREPAQKAASPAASPSHTELSQGPAPGRS
jgi:hypothetical protein